MERQRQLICWGISFCKNVINIKKKIVRYHIREVTKMVAGGILKGWWAVCQIIERRYRMQIEVAILISVISVTFSVYFGLKNNKRTDTKEIEERVKENTRINMKLDSILELINELKSERSEMRKELADHESRITKVEQSTSSAHHRLDGLEVRINDEKE